MAIDPRFLEANMPTSTPKREFKNWVNNVLMEDEAIQRRYGFGEGGIQLKNDILAASQGSLDAQQRIADAQRAGAAKQRAIQRNQLKFRLDTGLRDVEKGRERGLEGAVNNALQRGIYRSGIRMEMEERVHEDSDDAASDLRKQIEMALQALNAQGATADSVAAAQRSAMNQQRSILDLQHEQSGTPEELRAIYEAAAKDFGVNLGAQSGSDVVTPQGPGPLPKFTFDHIAAIDPSTYGQPPQATFLPQMPKPKPKGRGGVGTVQ